MPMTLVYNTRVAYLGYGHGTSWLPPSKNCPFVVPFKLLCTSLITLIMASTRHKPWQCGTLLTFDSTLAQLQSNVGFQIPSLHWGTWDGKSLGEKKWKGMKIACDVALTFDEWQTKNSKSLYTIAWKTSSTSSRCWRSSRNLNSFCENLL